MTDRELRPGVERLTTDEAGPVSGWIVFLHGILGRRRNWLSFARALTKRHPAMGALLVDVRLHGDRLDAAPPHTIEAAARDLADLAALVDEPIVGVLGHSLGGKVALRYAHHHAKDARAVWVVDSMPGPTVDPATRTSVLSVMDMLERIGSRFTSRQAFLAAVDGAGASRAIGEWLAMNLVRDGEGYVFPLSLPDLRALGASHFSDDLWPLVEAPRPGLRVHLIVGGKSPAFAAGDLARAERATAGGQLTVRVIPEAGHWVHVDAPEALLDLVSADVREDAGA